MPGDDLGLDSERPDRLSGGRVHACDLDPGERPESRPYSVNFSQMARTEFVEVKTTHW